MACKETPYLSASSSYSPHPTMWRVIWSLKCPLKVIFFWWKYCYNNLFPRKRGSLTLSSICKLEVESTEHLLFRCKWAIKVWKNWSLLNLAVMQYLYAIVHWFLEVLESHSVKLPLVFSKLILIPWHI